MSLPAIPVPPIYLSLSSVTKNCQSQKGRLFGFKGTGLDPQIWSNSNSVFYIQSTITVISGRVGFPERVKKNLKWGGGVGGMNLYYFSHDLSVAVLCVCVCVCVFGQREREWGGGGGGYEFLLSNHDLSVACFLFCFSYDG